MFILAAALLALTAHAADDSTRRPVQLGITLPSDWSVIDAQGGQHVAQRGLLVATATLDLARLARIPRATMFVQYLHGAGRPAGPLVGDLHGFSNIEAPRLARIGEWWVEAESPGGRLRTRLGNVDANTEYAWTSHGAIFLNSALGYSPAIVPLPSFPEPATSVNIFARSPGGGWTASAGVFDGGESRESSRGAGVHRMVNRPDALFSILELGRQWRAGTRHGRVGVGTWHHDAEAPHLESAASQRGSTGWYVVVDQTLLTRRADGDALEVVGLFGQFASADDRISPIARHASVGATIASLPGWGNDSAGVALSWVRTGGESPVASRPSELALELLYSHRVARWLAVRSDLQWIRAGTGTRFRQHATIATVRVVLSR